MRKLILFSIFILLMSCDFSIPPVTFYFYNQSSSSVTVTPNTGEDWEEFTLSPGGNTIIENIDPTIYFKHYVGGIENVVQYFIQNVEYSDIPPYTIIFCDINDIYDLTLLP